MAGWSEEQVAGFGMTFGVAAFMLFMLFIIAELAWKSKAGRGGTAVLFSSWRLAWLASLPR